MLLLTLRPTALHAAHSINMASEQLPTSIFLSSLVLPLLPIASHHASTEVTRPGPLGTSRLRPVIHAVPDSKASEQYMNTLAAPYGLAIRGGTKNYLGK